MANSYTVTEMPAGGNSTNADDKGFVSGTATRRFAIVLDSVDSSDDAVSIRKACQARALLPRQGDLHPSSILYICKDVQVDRFEGPLYCEAEATYTQTPVPQNEQDTETPPWNLPTKYSFKSVKTEEEIDEDADGNPIENPGTREPVQGITRPVTDLLIVAEKNFLFFDPTSIYEFNDAVNDDEFLSFPAGVVKVESIEANPDLYQDQQYYKVVVNLLARKPHNTTADKAWYFRRVIKGFYEAVPVPIAGLTLVLRAVDDERQPVTSPICLDQNGLRLAPGANREFQEIKRLKTKTLSQMGL